MNQKDFAAKLLEIVDMKLVLFEQILEANRKQDALNQVMETSHGYNIMAYSQSQQLDQEIVRLQQSVADKINEFLLMLGKE